MRNVTRHVTKRDTERDMSRVTVHVSHATTTTPHHTTPFMWLRLLVVISGSDRIRNNGYLPSPSFGFGQGRTR